MERNNIVVASEMQQEVITLVRNEGQLGNDKSKNRFMGVE